MCRALPDCGVEPLIVTTDADGKGGRLPVDIDRVLALAGARTLFFRRRWSEAYKYSFGLSRWLSANVSNYDLVHIHAVFSHSCLAAARACRRHGVPYVVRPLGTLDPWSLRQKRFRKCLFWYGGVKRMLQGAAAIHYTTVDERQLAEALPRLPTGVVIPLGVDEELLRPAASSSSFRQEHKALEQSPYVLMLGRLHPKKGLEPFIECFLRLTNRPPFRNWKLVLAGEGDGAYTAKLKRLVVCGGGDDRVVFAGWLGGDDRIAAIREAALLALPSYQENFGLSAVEALACGVPVLVSEFVNIADAIREEDAGWVTGLDQADLSRTLADALVSEDERLRRGAGGATLVRKRYTWSAVARQLSDLYRTITTKSPASARKPVGWHKVA